MADNKSCEGKVTTLQCMVCNFREVFTERQFKFTDGLSCYVCNGPVMPVVTKSGEATINRKTIQKKNKSVGTLTVDVDCSDALKGLKAIQREAKKATAALKELEDVRNRLSFLTIELETLDSVPKVFYKGEEITNNIHVGFDWSTQTDDLVITPTIDIEYADVTSKRPNIINIKHNQFGGDDQ